MLSISWLLPSYQQDDVPRGGALIFSLWQSPDDGKHSVRVQFVARTLDQMHEATTLSLSPPLQLLTCSCPAAVQLRKGFPVNGATFIVLFRLRSILHLCINPVPKY
jgi:4-phytase / acid phosphatase